MSRNSIPSRSSATPSSITLPKLPRPIFDPQMLAERCPLKKRKITSTLVRKIRKRLDKSREDMPPPKPPHPSLFPESPESIPVKRSQPPSIRIRARSVLLEPGDSDGPEELSVLGTPGGPEASSSTAEKMVSISRHSSRSFADATNVYRGKKSPPHAPKPVLPSPQTSTAVPASSGSISSSARSPRPASNATGVTVEEASRMSCSTTALCVEDQRRPTSPDHSEQSNPDAAIASPACESLEGNGLLSILIQAATRNIASLFTSHKRAEWTRADLWAAFHKKWPRFSQMLFDDALRDEMFGKKLDDATGNIPIYTVSPGHLRCSPQSTDKNSSTMENSLFCSRSGSYQIPRVLRKLGHTSSVIIVHARRCYTKNTLSRAENKKKTIRGQSCNTRASTGLFDGTKRPE